MLRRRVLQIVVEQCGQDQGAFHWIRSWGVQGRATDTCCWRYCFVVMDSFLDSPPDDCHCTRQPEELQEAQGTRLF